MKICGIPIENIPIDIVFIIKHIRYSGGSFIFKYKDRKTLKFPIRGNLKQAVTTLTLLKGCFITQEYKQLQVKRMKVVDIGANIGDTAIYFTTQGAKHIYAFEPFPYSFRIAQQNIKLNNMNNQITLINAGCGGKKDKLVVDPWYESDGGSVLRSFRSGKTINVLPLGEIVKKYRIKKGALKLDCEGCEYEVILKSSRNILRHFDQIILEYHHGYEKLKKYLEACGFKVTATQGGSAFNPGAQNHNTRLGILYAELLNR